MPTKIYKNYKEFQNRPKDEQYYNGVSPKFAEDYPNYKEMNETNEKCWNCYKCYRCEDCENCKNC